MAGKGVVESMLRVLGAVRGGGAEALAVQEAACSTFWNLSVAADNKVRGPVAGRCARAGCGCGLGARGDASALRMFLIVFLCVYFVAYLSFFPCLIEIVLFFIEIPVSLSMCGTMASLLVRCSVAVHHLLSNCLCSRMCF